MLKTGIYWYDILKISPCLSAYQILSVYKFCFFASLMEMRDNHFLKMAIKVS